MDALSVIVQQTDDKVSDLKNFLADGRCESLRITKRFAVRFGVCSLQEVTY
jgi:hypothetical protein